MDVSLDENDLHLPPDVVTSTPRASTKRRKADESLALVCQVCGKKYEKVFYFRKHVESHKKVSPAVCVGDAPSVADVSNETVHLDASHDLTLRKLNATDKDGFQVPLPPAAKKKRVATTKLKLVCTYCLKTYFCPKSFKNHNRTHTLEVAASRFPDTKTILENSIEICNQAMTSVANSVSVGKGGENFRLLIGHVIGLSSGDGDEWEKFSRKVCEFMLKPLGPQKFMLPSALLTNLLDQQERLVADFEFCDSFLKILNVEELFDTDLLCQFMLEFSVCLPEATLANISKVFKANLPQVIKTSTMQEPDKEDRQVIYYIAGSTVRSYVRKARRYPKSCNWQKVVAVLMSKVLRDKAEGDMDQDSEWTRDVDRGGLYYITCASQTLFVKFTKVIYTNEKCDGSIDYDKVVSDIGQSELCAEWDSIIGDSLDEDVSLKLMADVITTMCRTCGNGIARRRFNFLRSRPVVSLSTRHLVASRKHR